MEKKAGDIGIIICLIILMLYTQLKLDAWWEWLIIIFLIILSLITLLDLIYQFKPNSREKKYGLPSGQDNRIRELILLDEDDKPIKSWDLTGRISLLIGRDNPEEPVDVDLQESEYSAFIDYQHAVLNYCMDSWFIEDLNSHNGIRIQKIDDGICYKIMQGRPCRVKPGDIIYVANTKLLIS